MSNSTALYMIRQAMKQVIENGGQFPGECEAYEYDVAKTAVYKVNNGVVSVVVAMENLEIKTQWYFDDLPISAGAAVSIIQKHIEQNWG